MRVVVELLTPRLVEVITRRFFRREHRSFALLVDGRWICDRTRAPVDTDVMRAIERAHWRIYRATAPS